MFSRASGLMINGGTFNATTNISQSKRGIDILMEFIASDAMHDSKELYDAPKCHPHTRVAVLDDIMKWVIESGLKTQDDFILWLFGAAGAGKSAIAKRIAELAAEKGLLIGSFFFSRTSPFRNTQDRLIPTLAYQMTVSVPGTRTEIEEAIERDRAILHKNIQAQIDSLLVKPFQCATMEIIPSPKLIIIDGLDECNDNKAQLAILDAISRSFTKHKLPIICLVVSRPETDIVSSFNGKEPLKSVHRRLALDDTYHPDDDIRRFFSDNFEEIRCTHRLGSTIPVPWPTEESLETLVKKSSGQFIYAATVVRYVESNRHRPVERLNIILEISPPGSSNPFAALDTLYKQVLSSVEDIQLTLHVLSLYISSPDLASLLNDHRESESFLSLEEGDIDLALIGLASILSYDEQSREVKVLHASFVDFLSDKRRSDEFYLDMASARRGFACRTLQYVKAPDGILAGDVNLFYYGIKDGLILQVDDQLRNEVLNFDLDAFISATNKSPVSMKNDAVIWAFDLWISTISRMGFADDDEQLLIHRYRNSFESRILKYQTNWRLQLLLTLTVIMQTIKYPRDMYRVAAIDSYVDILLGVDDDDLRLLDKGALDLRRYSGYSTDFPAALSDISSRFVDGDRYASAALHCMHFLSDPPKYFGSGRYDSPGKGITYFDWNRTCSMAIDVLFKLLERANTSPDVIQFMSDHDINTTVHENFPLIDIWELDTSILAFLSRGGACVNWRIISAIQRARALSVNAYATSEPSESSEETDSDMYESADNGSDILSLSDLIT